MTQPTTANCQACNAPNSKSWVTITDCGATIICTQCLAELGDDRSKEAFYNLPDDREHPCEKCGDIVGVVFGSTRPDGASKYLCPDCYVPVPVFAEWNLGGNWLVQGTKLPDGSFAVWYEQGTDDNRPTFAIFRADDEEWTDPVVWIHCPTFDIASKYLSFYMADPNGNLKTNTGE